MGYFTDFITTTHGGSLLGETIIDNLQTKNIGVSASQSSDLTVASGTEERIAIDNTASPYFDDFGELDTQNNEIVLKHDSHHEIVGHAFLDAAGGNGHVELRVYVNDVERIFARTEVKNGEDAVLNGSTYLKLGEGDTVHATVEHNTGFTETFPGTDSGNFVSCVRQ